MTHNMMYNAWPVKVELVKMRTILELIGGRRCSSEPPKILSTVLSSMLEAGLDVQRDDLAVEWISMWPNWMMNWVAHVCAAESRLCWPIPMVTRFTIRAIYFFFGARSLDATEKHTFLFEYLSSLSWKVFFIWRKCILKQWNCKKLLSVDSIRWNTINPKNLLLLRGIRRPNI
jgi:hypothetical protein